MLKILKNISYGESIDLKKIFIYNQMVLKKIKNGKTEKEQGRVD
jgi:hypothetical protein